MSPSVILSDPPCKDGSVSLKHLSINNMENIVVFLDLKVLNSDNFYLFSCNRNTQFTFIEKPKLKIISFANYKH